MVKKTDDLQKKLEEVTNNWKRALADYQNLEKRVATEKEEFGRYANKELILKLLPVLDSLEKLAEHTQDDGARLIRKQFQDILRSVGVEKIEALGKDFNPEEMECVDVAPGEENKQSFSANKVLKETRAGYKLKEKVIRPAQVVVGGKGE